MKILTPMQAFIFTSIALIAFAANSVLGRLALTQSELSPTTFTAIRLASGAMMLGVLVYLRERKKSPDQKMKYTEQGSWFSALFLAIYALTFSIAYVSLETGTGALILFAAVQICLVLYSMYQGHHLKVIEWLGLGIAFIGFIYLVLPSLSTPSLSGLILMTISGVAWAGYTIKGTKCPDPLAETASNFIRTTPLIFVLLCFTHANEMTLYGLILGISAGAITSGIGYAIWYLALRGLTSTQAGVVQLCVPLLAAFGGLIFAQEIPDLRFYISSVAILGGIALVILAKPKATN